MPSGRGCARVCDAAQGCTEKADRGAAEGAGSGGSLAQRVVVEGRRGRSSKSLTANWALARCFSLTQAVSGVLEWPGRRANGRQGDVNLTHTKKKLD